MTTTLNVYLEDYFQYQEPRAGTPDQPLCISGELQFPPAFLLYHLDEESPPAQRPSSNYIPAKHVPNVHFVAGACALNTSQSELEAPGSTICSIYVV